MDLKKIYIHICAAATGLNIGIIVYGLVSSNIQLIPLGLLNILLLIPAFFMKEDKEL